MGPQSPGEGHFRGAVALRVGGKARQDGASAVFVSLEAGRDQWGRRRLALCAGPGTPLHTCPPWMSPESQAPPAGPSYCREQS